MNKYLIDKRNIIAIALVGLIVICGFNAFNISAAERIDTTADVTITAMVADNDTSIFATEYEGEVTVKLYQIATLDETGKAVATEKFANLDLSILGNTPTVDQVTTTIVEPAVAIAENETENATITIDRASATEGSVEIANGAGIYLYVIDAFISGRYEYSFTPYIIFAPTSTYIQTGNGDDTWNYESSFIIKSEAEEKFGNLKITKTVDQFNLSLGTASFVYKVVAKIGDEVVLDNVYMLSLEESGENSRVIEGIPASADVTVTEVYTGASYEPVSDDVVDGLVIVADEIVTAEFENTYDNRLIVGGIGVENQFVNEDGTIIWISPEGDEVPQTEVLELR